MQNQVKIPNTNFSRSTKISYGGADKISVLSGVSKLVLCSRFFSDTPLFSVKLAHKVLSDKGKKTPGNLRYTTSAKISLAFI